MQKNLNRVIGILLSLVFSAAMVCAQVTGGALTGTVVDPSGAVVPNATVTITDKSRGQVLTTQTTSAGSYQFPNVPVGEYTVTVEGSGFAKLTREANVSLNQTTTVDVALQVGGGTATVDVVAGSDGAVVQVDTSQLGRSFDQRKVTDLPINGNPNNLAVLAPNVIPPARGTLGAGGVSGGIRARGNSFNIDGVDNNDPGVTGPSVVTIIQDAVEEFTLLQNNFGAEFGAGAGGQFNTITKSGTNQYRGNIFGYVGSEKFNARRTDEDLADKKRFFKSVRYGGTFGGPLPFFNFGEGGSPFISGKNKLFFFAAYEKYYTATQSASGSYQAPTLAGLNQIGTNPLASQFAVNLLRNNLTLPTAATSTQTVLGVAGIPFGTVTLPVPSNSQYKSYQFNIDHLPNQKDQFRYRFAPYRSSAEQSGQGGLQFNNDLVYNTDLFSFNWIRTFSSSIVNDLRLSYRGVLQDYVLSDPGFQTFPNIAVNSLNLSLGPNPNLPQNKRDDSYQIYDSLTWIKGQHTFKFGADYRRTLASQNFLQRARGEFIYTTLDVLLQDLAPDFQNIRGAGSGAFVANHHRIYFFGQDDWKIRPNLTLNLGLRYEYQGNFRDMALQSTAAPANVPGVIEFNNPKADTNNFAPRIGFAWSPNFDNWLGRLFFGETGQSSIRANYARAFFVNFSNLASNTLPPTLQALNQNTGTATNFLANGGGIGTFTPNLTPAFLRANAANFMLDPIVPYSDSFAVSYQRQLGRNTGLEFRYLKTLGRLLPVQVQLNSGQTPSGAFVFETFLTAPTAAQLAGRPTRATVLANNPTLGVRPLAQFGFTNVLTAFPNIGESEYDGVSASLTRRFARNFGFTAAYTFSRTLDNSTNELNSSALNPRRPQDSCCYFSSTGQFIGQEGINLDTEKGTSPLDVPHRFVTSFNVEIPFFNNSDNAFLKAVLGGFQINGIFQIQSGQPITVLAGRDANLNGDSAGDRAIFNPNGDPNISSGIYAVDINGTRIQSNGIDVLNSPNTVAYVAINPNAGYISTGFLARELADQGAGTAERNSVRTRGYSNTDLVVLKNTRFGPDGRFNFQIGAEIVDLFNQRVRTIGGFNNVTTGSFATAGNSNFLNYTIAVAPGRSIVMRAKFFF